MKTITLTRGAVTIVEDYVFEWASKFKWHATGKVSRLYAARRGRKGEGRAGEYIYLHREILFAPIGLEIDHRDGDSLNNLNGNLRVATHSSNLFGFQNKPEGCTSRFRNVAWNSRAQKWEAWYHLDGRKRHLGCFVDEESAARARDHFQRNSDQSNFRNFPV